MGYYASGYGSFKIKEDCEDAIRNLLDNSAEFNDYNVELYTQGGLFLEFHHEYQKYYGEELEEALSLLAPYVEDGEITFAGEDDYHWRFILSGDRWKEEEGGILYSDPLPDGAFFIRRGGLTFTLTEEELLLASQAYKNSYRKEDARNRIIEKYIDNENCKETVSFVQNVIAEVNIRIDEGDFDAALANCDTENEIYKEILELIIENAAKAVAAKADK